MKYNNIVLLTDFGDRDNFVGVMKGTIYKSNPDIKIIDLCHRVMPQNIMHAAFLLKHSYTYFPEETVFLNVVDPGVGTERDIILLQQGKQIFIAPDNGLLSFIDSIGALYYKLIIPNKYIPTPSSSTFHGRDIFAPAAAVISTGVEPEKLSIRADSIKRIGEKKITINKNTLTGEIIYIDNFGNLITNIDKNTLFDFVQLAGSFKITIKKISIRKVCSNYSIRDKYGAVFNSFGLLEIFSPENNAEKLLNARLKEKITIIAG